MPASAANAGGIDMDEILITDSDWPSLDIERSIFEAGGYRLRVAQCRSEADVIAEGSRAIALLDQYAPITDAVLGALPRVRVVGRYGVSLDPVDVEAARRRGVRVVNVPDYCISEAADHALALILTLTRGIVALDRSVRRGTWDYREGGELRRTAELQLGLVGVGEIGTAVARRAAALGFRVVAADPRHPQLDGVLDVSLDELLATSDVVSLHAPLGPKTRHLIGERELRRMRPEAFLVNTSRGGLIDQVALVSALRSGALGGAALDVLEHEPIAADDPLLGLPNVVLTPHAAFFSSQSLVDLKTRVARGIVDALAETADGGSPSGTTHGNVLPQRALDVSG